MAVRSCRLSKETTAAELRTGSWEWEGFPTLEERAAAGKADRLVVIMSVRYGKYRPSEPTGSCLSEAGYQHILCSGGLQGTPKISKILFSLLPSTKVPSLICSLPLRLMTLLYNPL